MFNPVVNRLNKRNKISDSVTEIKNKQSSLFISGL